MTTKKKTVKKIPISKETLGTPITKGKKLISKELDAATIAMKEMLQAANEEQIKKQLTDPSAIALDVTSRNTGEGVNSVRKTIRQLLVLYLTNQFVARGVNVRADTLISKGFEIVGGNEAGIKACKDLVENSGGDNLFRQLGINTTISGDGFLEKIYNQKGTKIMRLKHVHPLTLDFERDGTTNKILLDENKEIKGYVQLVVNADGKEQKDPVNKAVIEHLKFNTLGDEFTGVSMLQPGYETIVRLMNMEYSAAEAAVKSANPLIIAKCNTKSPNQVAQWATILGRINGRDQIFVPEGMEVSYLSPGQQNFNDYADYFLSAVVTTLSVPKGVLLGASDGSGNRAEGIILTRHFYSSIRGNQRYMEDFFNKIFKEYADIAGFDAPRLAFNDIAEDAALTAQSAMELFTAGLIDKNEAREMLGIIPSVGAPEVKNDVNAEIKKDESEVQFPEAPGKKTGSQNGIKKKQKTDEMSEVSALTK